MYMAFDRRSGFFNRTLAWRLFKRHHTHFNDIFWANRAASKFAYAATRPHQRQTSAGVLFSLPGNHQRLTQTLGDWADNYSDFNQWTQLASVVAICGYLETYLAQISTAALESSPALIFGASSLAVDGTALLKAGNKYDFYQHVVPIVRGDWGARSAAYGRDLWSNSVRKSGWSFRAVENPTERCRSFVWQKYRINEIFGKRTCPTASKN